MNNPPALKELFAPLEENRFLEEYANTPARFPDMPYDWQDGRYRWHPESYGSGAFYGFLDDQQDALLHEVAAHRDEFSNRAFFAVAGGRITLDIIANGEFKAAVLSGIDPCQRNLWRDIFECVRESGGDRTKMPELFARFDDEKYKGDREHFTGYFARYFCDQMQADLARAESWLGSDAHFAHIHKLVAEGNLVTTVADALDGKRYQSMAALINQVAPVGLIYGSNVSTILETPYDFLRGRRLPEHAKARYWQNLQSIGDAQTPMIDGREHPTKRNSEIMAFDAMDILPLEAAAKRALANEKPGYGR